MSTFLMIQSWCLSAEKHHMRNVWKALDDSHLGFAKCCYRLNLKKWMAFIIGGLVPFLTLALLARVRSGAVSELRWKLILEKGKEKWFHPSRISCAWVYGHGSCNCRSFGPCWLQRKELLMSWLMSVNSLVAAILPPAPPPWACIIVMEKFPTFLLCLQLIKRAATELSLRQNSPVKSLVGLVHLCT